MTIIRSSLSTPILRRLRICLQLRHPRKERISTVLNWLPATLVSRPSQTAMHRVLALPGLVGKVFDPPSSLLTQRTSGSTWFTANAAARTPMPQHAPPLMSRRTIWEVAPLAVNLIPAFHVYRSREYLRPTFRVAPTMSSLSRQRGTLQAVTGVLNKAHCKNIFRKWLC
jgi:hypothetical protein